MALRDPPGDRRGLSTLESRRLPANRSVLLVEDDELVQLRLEALLAPAGYSMTSVTTIREARVAVATISFQIIIIDRTLPDGDGTALCAELKARLSQSRVFLLMLSARDSNDDVGAGLRAGADVYLSKRTSNAELLAYLDAASAAARFAASREGSSS